MKTWGQSLKAIFSGKMLFMLALGFSSGLPFMIVKDVLKAWMTDAHVDIKQIGLLSAVSLPYTLKFLWSPLMDRFSLPFLGRRRGWMLITQICLGASIVALGQFDPQQSVWAIGFMAIVVTFFAASQDIVIDAFRREYLTDEEMGLGSAAYANAYRLAMLGSVALALGLSDLIGWPMVHVALACLLVVGIAAVLLVKEPVLDSPPPRTIKEAVVEPFLEFFRRPQALLILAFVLLYKIGDNMASAMTVPFILNLGFAKTDYVVIVKGVGMIAMFGGMFLGGTLMMRLGLRRALWVFGLLQMISLGGFSVLAYVGKSHALLTAIIIFELLSQGMGTAAYSAYMALQTNTRFTATQYALMTSLMAVPGTLVASITGFMADFLGWPMFFVACMAFAIPGLLLINRVNPKGA